MNLANLPGGDEEEVDDEVEVSLKCVFLRFSRTNDMYCISF